jgi:DNA helicase-2/ATP-dependent DNA helicase PcrA
MIKQKNRYGISVSVFLSLIIQLVSLELVVSVVLIVDSVRIVEELLNSVKVYVEEKKNELFEELQAEGEIADGVELTASDLPVVLLGDFLENISLLSAVDMEDDEESSNKITLMTVHSSKGLEFPYVFVVGMEENIFPSGGWLASETEVEEERRLFYVAMTRAKKAVSFSFTQTRMRNGKHESNSPSRFIYEVDPQYIANPISKEREAGEKVERQSFSTWKTERNNAAKPGYSYGQSSRAEVVRRPQQVQPQPVRTQPTLIRRPQVVERRVPDADFEPTPVLQLKTGQRIEHNRFGFGKILEISGSSSDLKAKIAFDDHGEKILILKYAKIRVVNVCQ